MERLRPLRSPWWYAVAVALVTVGWVVAVAWQGSQWNTLRHSDVTVTGTAISSAKGRSVAVLTDLQQPSRTIVCTAVGPGRARTAIPAAPLSLDVTSGGRAWHLLALMKSGRVGMRVSCAPTDRKTDTASYGTVVTDAVGSRHGAPIAWTAAALALVLAAGTTVARRLAP